MISTSNNGPDVTDTTKSADHRMSGIPGSQTAASLPGPLPAADTPEAALAHEGSYERSSRLQLWLIISGFAMMFLASVLMWIRFGPTMFVDLATAVANCF